jgi:hypothetical protein
MRSLSKAHAREPASKKLSRPEASLVLPDLASVGQVFADPNSEEEQVIEGAFVFSALLATGVAGGLFTLLLGYARRRKEKKA